MKWLRGVSLTVLILAVFSVILVAVDVKADTIVQSYKTSSKVLGSGWLVTLVQDPPETVEPVPANRADLIYGIVIDPSQAPATLKNQTGNQVFIAVNGTYPVLVNTQNGNISVGDYVSISSTDGIAAKATEEQSQMLGQALESFDGKGKVIAGAGGSYPIGRINVSILPAKNPLYKGNIAVPESLRRLGEGIGGKSLSSVRIYAALAVFLATAIIGFSILFVGIRSGMIAIGRNPLSRHSIIKGLFQVVAVSVLIFAIGILGVYLLLKV